MSSSLRLYRLKLPDANDSRALAAAVERQFGDPERTLALDDYAAIHFVLTAEPPIPKHEALRRNMSWDDDGLENVLMGGEPVALAGTGEPARGLSLDRVAALARELEAIDASQFGERYDPEGLDEYQVPPGDWSDEVPDWLLGEYEALRRLFLSAARDGEGILIWPL